MLLYKCRKTVEYVEMEKGKVGAFPFSFAFFGFSRICGPYYGRFLLVINIVNVKKENTY